MSRPALTPVTKFGLAVAMAGGYCVGTNERQSGEYKLAFLICLGVVLRAHIRAEDVDLQRQQGEPSDRPPVASNLTA